MRNVVLLARPHPHLAPLMQRWLEASGFEPLVLHDVADVEGVPGEAVRGAVISSGVLSQVQLPPADVLRALRRWWPRLPIALATIADPQAMERSLGKTLAVEKVAVRRLDGLTAEHEDLGRPTLIVLLHREDLEDAVRRGHATRVLSRRFR